MIHPYLHENLLFTIYYLKNVVVSDSIEKKAIDLYRKLYFRRIGKIPI